MNLQSKLQVARTPAPERKRWEPDYPEVAAEWPIRLIVAGSRGWCCPRHWRNEHPTCPSCLTHIHILANLVDFAGIEEIESVHLIHGDCIKSPDVVAEAWAKKLGLPFTAIPADWARHGKYAGHHRNGWMAKQGTHLIALWDERSKGTQDMIRQALKGGLRVQWFSLSEIQQELLRGQSGRAPAPATQNGSPRQTQGPSGEHRAISIESGATWGGAQASSEKSAAVRSANSHVPETAQTLVSMGKSGDFRR